VADILKRYLYTKYEFCRSMLSQVRALQADRQRDRETQRDRHRDRYATDKITTRVVNVNSKMITRCIAMST